MTVELSKKRTAADKRETFCIEYLKDKNATQAAIRAGYSPNSANEQGARLLANASVKARLAELVPADNEKRMKDGNDLKEMLIDAATLDLTELIQMGRRGVDIKEFEQIPKNQRRLITEITNVSGKSGWRVNFKVYSKEKAVELLAKVFGIDKGVQNNIQINVSFSSLVEKYGNNT